MERYISEIVYTFLYIVLCKMFVEIFAVKKKEKPAHIIWIYFLMLTVFDCLASAVLAEDFAIKQIAVILSDALIVWLCYQTSFLKSVLIILFYHGLGFVTDYIAWMGFKKLLAVRLDETALLQLLMGTLSQLLVFSIIIILRRHFAKGSVESLSNLQWIKFSVFPIFTMAAVIAMLVNFNGLRNERQANTLICLAFGMLMLNIFVFYLLWDAIDREVKIRNGQLLAERAKSQTEMYRQISENFDRQKKREHEYKNEMMVISSLLDQNEFEKLRMLLDKYNDEIAHRIDAIDTNNVIVNAVLNTKHQEARDKGILFVPKVSDLSELPIEDEDIVVILSNMLNNAIEACEKCKGKRIIRVKAVKEGGDVIFSVINTIEEAPCLIDNKYRTTKKGQLHGMGIENVKETAGKYGGTCSIRHDGEQFYFVVYISE